MTPDEMTELVDLYAADELPASLRAFVEKYLQAHPDAAHDAESLSAVVSQLRSAPAANPDAWFREKLLDRLLRDASQEESSTSHSGPP